MLETQQFIYNTVSQCDAVMIILYIHCWVLIQYYSTFTALLCDSWGRSGQVATLSHFLGAVHFSGENGTHRVKE